MGFFSKLFGKKDKEEPEALVEPEALESVDKSEEDLPKVTTVPMSTIFGVPEGATIVAQSEVPEAILLGNLIYEGKYVEAIEEGERMLLENPKDNMDYINLMVAYFKARNLDASYYDKSTECARLAILYGHNTGYAHLRLIINLTKNKEYHKALNVLDAIITKKLPIDKQGIGYNEDWNKRKQSILSKLSKAVDKEGDVVYTPEELTSIQRLLEEEEARKKAEEKEREEYWKKELGEEIYNKLKGI